MITDPDQQPVYVILLPHRSTNDSDRHLVVRADEYVSVWLGDKDTYELYCSEHPDWESAAIRRDELNHPPAVAEVASEPYQNKGVRLLRRTPRPETAGA